MYLNGQKDQDPPKYLIHIKYNNDMRHDPGLKNVSFTSSAVEKDKIIYNHEI